MRRLAYGIDNLEAGAIEEASELMTDGNRLVTRAGVLMDDLMVEIGL